MARRMLLVASCLTAFAAAARIERLDEPPTEEEEHAELWQCSRQCRWAYGFFDRTIKGKEAKHGMCDCYDGQGEELDQVKMYEHKRFDVSTTWSGGDVDGDRAFNCEDVCVELADGSLDTRPRAAALGEDETILHCGWCAACSSHQDIEVISRTRDWITETMTSVSAAFAAPWGHKDPNRLEQDLIAVGFDVSTTPPSNVGRPDSASMPSCMDCWVDNIMCDAMTCKSHCWIKFFNAANSGGEITGGAHWWEFNKKCLECDELNCGPEFIKCAGANRRSSSIISDIGRPDTQVCPVGLYSGVKPKELPTTPQPDDAFVKRILKVETEQFPSLEIQKRLREIHEEYMCCCRKDTCKWFHHSLAGDGDKCPGVDEENMCVRHCDMLFDRHCHTWKSWKDAHLEHFCGVDQSNFFEGLTCEQHRTSPVGVDQTLELPPISKDKGDRTLSGHYLA